IRALTGMEGMVTSAFDSTGTRLASGTLERSVKVVRLETGVIENQLVGHHANIMQVAWSPDDEMIATASTDGTARRWSSRTGDLLAVLDHQQRWVWAVSFSRDGARVATGCATGEAFIWELPRYHGSRDALERI